jgi:hypothetical protein
MAQKPSSGDVPMTALNVDVPSEMMDRIKLAKLLTKQSIREIATEAFEEWLKKHGVTSEKMPKLNR